MNKSRRLEEDMDIFRKRWQHVADKMVNYELNDRNEIIILLNDGRKFVYDPIGSTISKYIEDVDYIKGLDNNKYLAGFSARLVKQMRNSGMSRWKLAEITGLSEVSISKYVNGLAMPSLSNARRLARALGCSIDDLGNF